MTSEKTIKFTLDKNDQSAVNTVVGIIDEIVDQMDDWDTFIVYGQRYDRDFVETVKWFLADLWHNGDCACEIKED